MNDETNPYSPPHATAPDATLSPPIAGETHRGLPGRAGLWITWGLCSLLAVLSLIAFVVQFNYTLPTGESFVRTNPMWVFSHLVRGVGLSILSWQLLRYIAAIRKVATVHDLQRLSGRHAALWNWAAIVLLSIAGYSIAAVVFLSY